MPLRKEHRVGVRDFDWQKYRTRPPFGPLEGTLLKLADTTRAALAKAQEIDRSPSFTAAGRREAKRAYAATVIAPMIKAAVAQLDAADEESARIRAKMTGPAIDRSDQYSAGLRREAREFLRSLPDGQRTAMLLIPDQLDPLYASAIMEAPAEWSGVSHEQKLRVQNFAIGARYPEEARTAALISEAAETFDYFVQDAMKVVSKALDVHDLAEMAELRPTLSETIATRIAAGDPQAA